MYTSPDSIYYVINLVSFGVEEWAYNNFFSQQIELIRQFSLYSTDDEGTMSDLKKEAFLSPPVRMHGGLICITLRLYVIGPKVTFQKVISLEPVDLGQGSWVRVKGHVGQSQRLSGLSPA